MTRAIPAISGFDPFSVLDDADPVEKVRAERESAEAEMDQHILNTFSTPSGKVAWDYLLSRTERVEGFAADLGLLNGIAWGFAREGQNSIIRHLRQRMAAAIARAQEKG